MSQNPLGAVPRTPVFGRLKPLVILLSLPLFTSAVLAAETINTPERSPLQKASSIRQSASWARWLLSSVEQLPSQQALVYRSQTANFERVSASASLYSPEITLGYEDKDEQAYSLGISQTLDWSGKRSAQTAAAESRQLGEQREITQQREAALARALNSLIDYASAQQLLALAQQQQQGLDQLSRIAEKRQRAGDLQPLDAELAQLSIAGLLPQLSAYRTEQLQSVAALRQSLNVSAPVFNMPPLATWLKQVDSSAQVEKQARLIDSSPSVQTAKQAWLQSQREAEVARRNQSLDPTLGLSANSEGEEDYVALAFSMPLSTSSRLNSAYRAAMSRSLEREVLWRDSVRLATSELSAKLESARLQQVLWLRWQALTEGRSERSKNLLSAQLRSGDITTRDYLFGVQQRSDALIAGIELSRQVQKSWVDWLLSTQQLDRWLQQLADSDDRAHELESSAPKVPAVSALQQAAAQI